MSDSINNQEPIIEATDVQEGITYEQQQEINQLEAANLQAQSVLNETDYFIVKVAETIVTALIGNEDFTQFKAAVAQSLSDAELQKLAELSAKRTTARATINTNVARINEIGKVEQTAEGDGSMANPYKYWSNGTEVRAGDWWMTDDGYLWLAIKDGIPTSSIDAQYWDIIE